MQRGSESPKPTERRAKDRREARLTGKIRRTTGAREEVRLLDLSPGGCRLDGASYKVGEKVWISIGGLTPIEGQVRWVSGEAAGLQFQAPLYPAMADHLVNTGQTAAPVRPTWTPRARTGEVSTVSGGARAGWISELRDPYRR